MQMMKHFCTSRAMPGMPYFGRGANRLQPISVRDVAACFVKCLAMPETEGKTYELGGPEQLTWKELYDACASAIAGRSRRKLPVPVPLAKVAARTIVPLLPAWVMPFKFGVDEVQMSQEDSTCQTAPIEEAFHIRLSSFREELGRYADQIA
jgi:NADH dehydrogenase